MYTDWASGVGLVSNFFTVSLNSILSPWDSLSSLYFQNFYCVFTRKLLDKLLSLPKEKASKVNVQKRKPSNQNKESGLYSGPILTPGWWLMPNAGACSSGRIGKAEVNPAGQTLQHCMGRKHDSEGT